MSSTISDIPLDFELPVGSIWKLNNDRILGKDFKDFSISKISSCLKGILERYLQQTPNITGNIIIKTEGEKKFTIIYAILEKKSSSPFVTLLGKRKKKEITSINSIFFLCRVQPQCEIYSFTTDTAFHIVKSYTDYQFTPKIAKRILLREEIQSAKKRKLTGTKAASESFYRDKFPDWKMTDVYSKTEEFNTKCRPKCSLLSLEPFKTQKTTPCVKLSQSHLRILKKLHLKDLFLLIDHLSQIDRGERTYLKKINSNETSSNDSSIGADCEALEEDSSDFGFLEYFQNVNDTLFNQLEAKLLADVWMYFVNQTPNFKKNCSRSFHIFHPKYDEFLNKSEIFLKQDSDEKSTDRSTEDILNTIQKFNSFPLDSYKKFVMFLKSIELGFHDNFVPLIRTIEGTVCLDDKSYFKINGNWFKLTVEFNIEVHRAFYRFFSEHFLTNRLGNWIAKFELSEEDKKYIPNILISKENLIEKDFSKSEIFLNSEPKVQNFIKAKFLSQEYLKEKKDSKTEKKDPKTEKANNINYFANKIFNSENYFVCADTLLKDHIELFDLMEIDVHEDAIYLYQTKQGVGKEAREACSQLLMSAKQVASSLVCSSSETFLEAYFRQLVQPDKSKSSNEQLYKELVRQWLVDKFGNIDTQGPKKFLEQFRSVKNIYFVYACFDEKKNFAKLPNDKCFSDKDFHSITQNGKSIEAIVQQLKLNKFLDEKGKLTDKFVYARYDKTIKTFHLDSKLNDTVHTKIYKILRDSLQGPFDSPIPKYMLLKTKKDIEDLSTEQWTFHFKFLHLSTSSAFSSTTPDSPSNFSSLTDTNFSKDYEYAFHHFNYKEEQFQFDDTPLSLKDFQIEKKEFNDQVKEKIKAWWYKICYTNNTVISQSIQSLEEAVRNHLNQEENLNKNENLNQLLKIIENLLSHEKKIKIKEKILKRKIKNFIEEKLSTCLPNSSDKLKKALENIKSDNPKKWFETYKEDWQEWIKNQENEHEIKSIQADKEFIEQKIQFNLDEAILEACYTIFPEIVKECYSLKKEEIEILASICQKIPIFYHLKNDKIEKEGSEYSGTYIHIYEKDQIYHLAHLIDS